MIFQFQLETAEEVWDPLGTGEGDGQDAIRRALADLATLSDAELPAGRYRCLAGSADLDARWRYLLVDEAGEVSVCDGSD